MSELLEIKDTAKLTNPNNVFSTGNINLSILIFFSKEALSTIEDMLSLVAPTMKLNSVCPIIKYRAKFSIWNRKTNEKTAVSTTIIRSGFNTDQKTPRTLLRYLRLKSRDTSEEIINQFRL